MKLLRGDWRLFESTCGELPILALAHRSRQPAGHSWSGPPAAGYVLFFARRSRPKRRHLMNRRVGFLFLGPPAHIAHAATVAFELHAMPGFDAVGLISSDAHAATLADLAGQYGGSCTVERLYANPL